MFAPYLIDTWIAGTLVALAAGVVGFFAVTRGSTFPAHAIPNGAFAGAAGAYLLGLPVLGGLAVFATGAALTISALGRRARNDVATALTLVLLLSTGSVFISQSGHYEQQIYGLLFGDVLGVSRSELLPLAGLSLASVAAALAMYRRLLWSSVLPEVAEASGVASARTGTAFLVVLGLAAAMTVPVVGTLLIFSLMVGPPAAARVIASGPLRAIALSVAVAEGVIWASIALSYLSNWPIGFFVGALGAAAYLCARAYERAVPSGSKTKAQSAS